MAYSNRPSKWADPGVAPVVVDRKTGRLRERLPFEHSDRAAERFAASGSAKRVPRRLVRLEARYGRRGAAQGAPQRVVVPVRGVRP